MLAGQLYTVLLSGRHLCSRVSKVQCHMSKPAPKPSTLNLNPKPTRACCSGRCTARLCETAQVKEAYPCSRACGSDSNTGVELDAESAVAAHEAMHAAGLVAVGW